MTAAALVGGKRVLIGRLWSPRDLGSQLVGWFDFSKYADEDSVVDLVSGAAFTAEGAAAVGIGPSGRRVGLVNGTDAAWMYPGVPNGWPVGAEPGWMLAVVNQTLDPASTGSRYPIAYGGVLATGRALARFVSGGVNRARAVAGTGVGSVTVTQGTVDFTGRHVLYGTFSATAVNVEIDGVAGTPAAVVPATGTDRSRIGALSNDPATAFCGGEIAQVLVGAGALSAGDKALLAAWANSLK